MHFTNINGILTSPNKTSFFRYKAIITIGIGLVCVILVCLEIVVKFPKHFSLFFSKDKDKGHDLD